MPAHYPIGGGSRFAAVEVPRGGLAALIGVLAPADEDALRAAACVIVGWPAICFVRIEVYSDRGSGDSFLATCGSGEWATHELSRWQLVLLDHDRVIGLLSIAFDESEFVEAEVPARCETAALLISGAAARYRLEATLLDAECAEVTGQIAAGLVHDFNNMLTGILGNAAIARALLSPVDRAALALERVEEAARSAAHLSHALLDIVRGEMGRAELSVNELAVATQRALTQSVRSDIAVILDLAPDLPTIEGEQPLIRQALINLVLNAAESIEGGGSVTIRTRRVDEVPTDCVGKARAASSYIALSVADTGSGIAPEHLSQLFHPFFSTRGSAGTGLGLTLVAQVAARHGGAVSVTNQPGRGSTFTIYLPEDPPPPTDRRT